MKHAIPLFVCLPLLPLLPLLRSLAQLDLISHQTSPILWEEEKADRLLIAYTLSCFVYQRGRQCVTGSSRLRTDDAYCVLDLWETRRSRRPSGACLSVYLQSKPSPSSAPQTISLTSSSSTSSTFHPPPGRNLGRRNSLLI